MNLLVVTVVKLIKSIMKDPIRCLCLCNLLLIFMSQGPLLLSWSLNLLLNDFDTLITAATHFLWYGLIQLIIHPDGIIISIACNFFHQALGNKTDRAISVGYELA